MRARRLPWALLVTLTACLAARLAASAPPGTAGAPMKAKSVVRHRRPQPTFTFTPTPTPLPAWPTFKGDNARTGRGPALGLPVKVAWRVALKGSLYSSPAIAQGLVVLGSSNKKVTALDLDTGEQRWQQALPDRVWGSAPAIDHDRVYIGCVDGCVYALSLTTGAVAGTYCAKAKGKGVFNDTPDVLSSPLVQDGRLVFGSDNHDVYGWDLDGRKDPWRFATGDIVHDNAAACVGGTLTIASRDGKLYALDLATGALRWSFSAKKFFNTVPAMDRGRVYAGSADGRLYALDAATGTQAWAFDTGKPVMSSPSFSADGGLVFGSSNGKVYCLNAADGAVRWSFKTGDYVLASPLITGGLAWVGSYDDKFYALDLATGQERWSIELDGGIFTSAAAVGGRIVVAGRGGDLVCLEATVLSPDHQP